MKTPRTVAGLMRRIRDVTGRAIELRVEDTLRGAERWRAGFLDRRPSVPRVDKNNKLLGTSRTSTFVCCVGESPEQALRRLLKAVHP